MRARELFDSIKNKMKELEAQSTKIDEERWELGKLANEAFKNLIIEEKLLAQKTWLLSISTGGRAYLTAEVRTNEWKELSDFAQTNYHCQFSLTDENRINFDDGDITIYINDIKHLKGVIKQYDLNVKLCKSAEDNLKVIQQTIDNLKDWQVALND